MSNKIFFQLWNPTGMINQVMSFELAAGLAHETKNTTLIHFISNHGDNLYDYRKVPIYTPSRWYNNQRQGFTDPDQFPHLTDILEYDQNLDLILIDPKIESFRQNEFVVEEMMQKYYYSSEPEITEDELLFAEQRNRLDLNRTVHLKNTLGWYSRFFYKRSPELDKALASVKFKQPYVDLAKKISDSIGPFQGMHLRLSDHLKMFNTTREMFEYWLDRFEANNIPILLSTCEPGNEMVIANKHRVIMLDEIIVNNFSEEFKTLEFNDEVIFGLICNLVLHDSVNFVGTSGSTYTAYVHRKRNQRGLETWDFFDRPETTEYNNPYSWVGHSLEGGRKMWWREWPESKLNF